jgi:hypothetical protein
MKPVTARATIKVISCNSRIPRVTKFILELVWKPAFRSRCGLQIAMATTIEEARSAAEFEKL